MGIIYITTNKINGKKYIGVDTKNNKYYYGSGVAIKLAIEKYGKENFVKEIIENNDDVKYLFEREIYWINYYDAVNSSEFYNISYGGKGGNMLINEDSIKKHKDGVKKTILLNKGRKGKTYEEIYGDRSDEEKEKRKLSGLGKKYDEERIKKVSMSLKGRVVWNKGLTKETDIRVRKYGENMVKPKYLKIYKLTTINNEFLEFNGRKNLEQYIKNINKKLKKGYKINCNNLIKNKIEKGYSLIIT